MTTIESTLTCPECGQTSTETVPEDRCWFFYDCPHCRSTIRPKDGDCCVFCSSGSRPCPTASD